MKYLIEKEQKGRRRDAVRRTMIAKNEVYTVTVTDLNNLGYGVARIEGMVVFVSGAVDGDVLEIRIIKVTKRYCVGKIEKILTPSPYRCAPACAVASRCGGCMYMHVDYAHELVLKRRRVQAALRHAGMAEAVVDEVQTASSFTGYRNKIQLPVCDGKIGYYAPHSHTIIDGGGCQLQHPVFEEAVRVCRKWLSAYPTDAARVHHLYMRCASGSDPVTVMVCLVVTERPDAVEALVRALTALPAVRSIQLNYNAEQTNVILGSRTETLWGEDALIDRLGGLQFRVSATSFYQVNREAATLAYDRLLTLGEITSKDVILDLYCGTGTIGLYLKAHSHAAALRGVEVIPSAIADARKNAMLNSIENSQFICGDALEGAAQEDFFRGVTIAVVDPPRKGCSSSLLERICKEGIPRLLYMSCEAETFARDAAFLCANGYHMSAVTPIDLFPRTAHVETVCLLSKLLN